VTTSKKKKNKMGEPEGKRGENSQLKKTEKKGTLLEKKSTKKM